MPRSRGDAFGEYGNSLKVIPANTNTFPFRWRFLEIRYFVVFIRGWIIEFGADIDLFAEAHGGGSFVEDGGEIIDLMAG